MGWAEEQLKKYLNQIMPSLRRIRVVQILDYFPCLTDIDKENIRAHVDREGNKQSVWIFLDILYGREGWANFLIEALRDSNMEDLAAEIESVYTSYLPKSSSVRSIPAAAKAASCVPATGASVAPSSNVPLVSPPCNTPSSNDLHPPASSSSSQAALKPPLPTQREAPGEKSADKNPIQESEGLPPSSDEAVAGAAAAAKEDPSSSPESNPAAPGEKKAAYDYCDNRRVQEGPHATSSDLDQLAPKWDGRQQHPVCVKNGYFGNLPGDSSVLSPSAASPDLGVSANQPEEDDYVSSDNHPSAATGQDRRTPLSLPDVAIPDGTRLSPSARPSKPPAASTSPDVTPSRPSPQVSVAPNDDLKPSVQEKKLSSGRQDDSTTPGPAKREVTGNFPRGGTRPLDVRNVSPASVTGRENRPPRPSRDSRIIYSNRDADGELCKPGILSMTPKGAGSGLGGGPLGSSEPEPAYSGETDRLQISSSFSLGSDPLLLSDLSQSSQPEESFSNSPGGTVQEREARSGAGNPPPSQPFQGSRGDNGSIRTLTIRVEEPPSVDLNEAPVAIGGMNRASLRSSASMPDLATGCQPGNVDRSCQKDSRDSCSDEKGDSTYGWLFGGFALAAVVIGVAFVLFKKK